MASKSAIKSFNHSLYRIMTKHKNGISNTSRQGKIERIKCINHDLQSMGYVLRNIHSLKARHVTALVAHWKERKLSVGRIKNLMSDLRFISSAINKTSIVKNNRDYDIGARHAVSGVNRAIVNPDFSGISDPRLHASVQLQRVFGLRREECLKIKPNIADRNNFLKLEGSWTKGGVGRMIPIRTEEQRFWLEQAKILVNQNDSMIPNDKTYLQQRRYYDRTTGAAGFNNLHGLRHAYAQERYRELSGWDAPVNGGRQRSELSKDEQAIDRKVRRMISGELGHSRVAVTRIYLG